MLYTGHAEVPAWGGTDENENKIAGPRPTAYGETFKNCGSESTARASGVRSARMLFLKRGMDTDSELLHIYMKLHP